MYRKQNNVWGIREFTGDGKTCPVMPVSLPWYKKFFLFFFRFGICPFCMLSSIGWSIQKWFGRKLWPH